MELAEIIKKSEEVRNSYRVFNEKNGHKRWGVAEYAQGFVGDVGDLLKLIMAKNNFRHKDDIDKKLAHELSDCLWSIFAISSELGVDLEKEFLHTMEELKEKTKVNGD